MNHFDLIVIGCGGMGSAAVSSAAKDGLSVLGIDRWEPPHTRGSSHGQTRVIRQAYFEHPDYVPLLLRSYTLWRELEQEVDQQLLVETGILEIGPPDGVIVPGVLRSATQHGLAVEQLPANEVQRRFPRFCVPSGHAALFEQAGGYLLVESCVEANLSVAARHNAKFLYNAPVHSICREAKQLHVIASNQSFSCDRIIFTSGAFTSSLLPELDLPLKVLRKHMHWFHCQTDSTSAPDVNSHDDEPIFFYETDGGFYYGFPPLDECEVKVAEHSGGEVVVDPATIDGDVDPAELARVSAFLDTHLRGKYEHRKHQTCMYTMTPDEHFILDFHPDDHRIVVGCGFSGHGFKFAPVVGEVLAKLATSGTYCAETQFLLRRHT